MILHGSIFDTFSLNESFDYRRCVLNWKSINCEGIIICWRLFVLLKVSRRVCSVFEKVFETLRSSFDRNRPPISEVDNTISLQMTMRPSLAARDSAHNGHPIFRVRPILFRRACSFSRPVAVGTNVPPSLVLYWTSSTVNWPTSRLAGRTVSILRTHTRQQEKEWWTRTTDLTDSCSGFSWCAVSTQLGGKHQEAFPVPRWHSRTCHWKQRFRRGDVSFTFTFELANDQSEKIWKEKQC